MIETYYKENHRKLVNRVLRSVGGHRDVAEDVVQEAFFRAIKFETSYDSDRSSFKTWFNSILRNAVKDAQMNNRDFLETNIEDCSLSDVLNVPTHALSIENRNAIDIGIKCTRKYQHRRVLELFYVMGYSSKDICQIEEGMSISNVTTIVNRFKTSFLKGNQYDSSSINL